jgi:hypothetical protein
MTEIQRRRPRPHRRPAQVIDARPIPHERWETIVGSRVQVMSQLRRGAARREYARVGEFRQIGRYDWAVDVLRRRDPVPRWARPALIAGAVLATLAAFAGLGVWLFTSIGDALAGKGTAVFVGLGLLGLGTVMYAVRRPVAEVTVRLYR